MTKVSLSSFFAFFLFPFVVFSQGNIKDTVPSFLIDSKLPPFKIYNVAQEKDTTWFTNDDLPKKSPVCIIYFSPECGHCQNQAEEMSKKKENLSKIFFVWTCFGFKQEQVDNFVKKYGLDKQENVKVGRLEKYDIPAYYKVQFTPYIGVYNKHKKFVGEFRRGAKPDEIFTILEH